MKKKWLYFFVIALSLTGGAWVAWNRIYYIPSDPHTGMNLCLFKAVTGIPCPSCGTTRSVLDITRLHFGAAFYENPFGFLLASGMIVFPFWVLYDLANKRDTFYHFYLRAETVIRKRWVTISLIFIVAANWAWNIYKFKA